MTLFRIVGNPSQAEPVQPASRRDIDREWDAAARALRGNDTLHAIWVRAWRTCERVHGVRAIEQPTGRVEAPTHD